MKNLPRIHAVLFKEGDFWCAQCLQYDLVAQAKSLEDLHYELQKVLTAHIAISFQSGREPFEGLEPAPQKFWDMFNNSKFPINAGEEISPFRMPKADMPAPCMPIMHLSEMRT